MTRYRVTCVTGWTVNQGGHGASSRRPPKSAWQVLDSANCFHIVREFRPGWVNTHRGVLLELEARAYAAELEESYP